MRWGMIWTIYWTRSKESFGRSPVNLPPPPIKAQGRLVVTSHDRDCVYIADTVAVLLIIVQWLEMNWILPSGTSAPVQIQRRTVPTRTREGEEGVYNREQPRPLGTNSEDPFHSSESCDSAVPWLEIISSPPLSCTREALTIMGQPFTTLQSLYS